MQLVGLVLFTGVNQQKPTCILNIRDTTLLIAVMVICTVTVGLLQ